MRCGKTQEKEMRKRQAQRGKIQRCKVSARVLIWGALLLAAVVLELAARMFPDFAEWYAVRIYPLIVGTLGRLCSLVPFSVAEILLYAGVILTLIGIALVLLRRWALRRALWMFARAGVVLALMFTLNCGINYHRMTFAERAGFEIRESSVEELRALCEQLANELNEAAQEIAADAQGSLMEKGELEIEAVRAMQAIGEEYPELSGYYPRPKPVIGYWFLSYQQLQGIYSPFTVEANYNSDMPQQDKPSTLCHELSHLKGFMREDEANFIAYLACRASDNALFRYSGALLAWIYSGNALYAQDPDGFLEIREELSSKVLQDLQEHNEYWNAYDGAVAQVADKINDTYLRANAQDDGTKSYGRKVDLLLAWNQKRDTE